MNQKDKPRRNLVVVRAGKDSFHTAWIGPDRSWDMIVSYYDDTTHDHPEDVRLHRQPGGKWNVIHALVNDPAVIDAYDYFWFPDDDIIASCEDINAIFEAMRHYDLDIAQPALTRDSYYSHLSVLACPGFHLRYTNFIEVMVPCLSRAVLRQIMPAFEISSSGFGLDSVWHRLSPRRYNAAILDFIQVQHTRPVGRFLARIMERRNQSQFAELQAMLARYGLSSAEIPLVYAAHMRGGRLLESQAAIGLLMARSYLLARREFSSQRLRFKALRRLVRPHFTRAPDWTPLYDHALPRPAQPLK